METVAEYANRRKALNELVLSRADLPMKRFFCPGSRRLCRRRVAQEDEGANGTGRIDRSSM